MKMMEECNSITSLHIFEFLDDSWASWVCIYFKSVAGTAPPLFLYNSTGLAAKRKPMLWGSSRGAEARASMCMMLAIKMHPELFDCELWTQSKTSWNMLQSHENHRLDSHGHHADAVAVVRPFSRQDLATWQCSRSTKAWCHRSHTNREHTNKTVKNQANKLF